jgi:glycosyltransferase involved in cell wall biosynthesis
LIIYFVGAGFEKTGVLSLGVLLKKSFEDEVVLVVLDSRLESKPYIYDVLVPIEDSHLPNVISRAVVRSRIKWPERVTILPNNTDCGYEVARLLSETFRSMRVVTSVVGIVHSNICTSIKLVAENIFLLDKVFAVSDAILMSTTAEIQASIPCRLLGYPSRTITKISRRPRTKRRHTELLKIIFVGRLVEDQKRFSRVLRLVEELRLANLPFILNVVGDGYMAAELAQVALAGSSVTPDVYPRGELTNEDVLQAMRESDVLVLTSEFEGSPFVVM